MIATHPHNGTPDGNPVQSDVLTLKEWFRRVGISERTARRMVAARTIPGLYRLGGQWRIRMEAARGV